jgi:hypothetical protein
MQQVATERQTLAAEQAEQVAQAVTQQAVMAVLVL